MPDKQLRRNALCLLFHLGGAADGKQVSLVVNDLFNPSTQQRPLLSGKGKMPSKIEQTGLLYFLSHPFTLDKPESEILTRVGCPCFRLPDEYTGTIPSLTGSVTLVCVLWHCFCVSRSASRKIKKIECMNHTKYSKFGESVLNLG